jgi:site-specific recombinase XerD
MTGGALRLPALVSMAGAQASKRYFEFFTVTIRNDHTRAGYFHACRVFFDWCEQRGLALEAIEPIHVAAYIESRAKSKDRTWHLSKTSIKQHASALRMMFSYFVEKGVLPFNPAREVSTEKVRRNVGKTPAFETKDVARLLASFDITSVVGLRDRALVAVMAFGFSRVGAIVDLRVDDYIRQGRRASLRIHGKGGVEVDIPVHHQLAEYLDTYIDAAGIANDRDGFLFRSSLGKTKQLTDRPMTRTGTWKMVQRRLEDVGIGAGIGFGCHSFRTTCGTNFLRNGGDLETCQVLMGHADSRTTKLYDRRALEPTLADIERIRYDQ